MGLDGLFEKLNLEIHAIATRNRELVPIAVKINAADQVAKNNRFLLFNRIARKIDLKLSNNSFKVGLQACDLSTRVLSKRRGGLSRIGAKSTLFHAFQMRFFL